MHPRLKRNICFSAGETIYHPPITRDKHSDISSRSKDEVQTNSVCPRADVDGYSEGLRKKNFHIIHQVCCFFFPPHSGTLTRTCSSLALGEDSRSVLTEPRVCFYCLKGLGFAALVLPLDLLRMTVIQWRSGRVVSSLSKGKRPHLNVKI